MIVAICLCDCVYVIMIMRHSVYLIVCLRYSFQYVEHF